MIQRTLAIIKPDAVKAKVIGEIISMIEYEDFDIVDMKMVHLSIREAKAFYAVHKGKHFFKANARFMASGPCIMMILEGENVISAYRELMGATDHTQAEPGTIRYIYGTNIRRNAVHGSDSEDSAEFEIDFFNNIE